MIPALLSLGADATYQADGFDPLYTACLYGFPEFVDLFLTRGATPNVILEREESLLDAVQFDQWHHQREAEAEERGSFRDSDSDHAGMAQRLAQIVASLERAGAKHTDELRAFLTNAPSPPQPPT